MSKIYEPMTIDDISQEYIDALTLASKALVNTMEAAFKQLTPALKYFNWWLRHYGPEYYIVNKRGRNKLKSFRSLRK